jgi:hypothetical protein
VPEVAEGSEDLPVCGKLCFMAPKKINFRRTTIARAKAAVKKHRAAKKNPARSLRGNPK